MEISTIKKRIVNSFHEYGTKENNKNFKIIAYSYDKIIKGIKHNNLPIFGDVALQKKYFN